MGAITHSAEPGAKEPAIGAIPARSVGSVTGIVAAAGGLGGYFPPLVMGATYNAADNNYTIGLLLLVATALIAFAYTALRLHAYEPVRAAPDKESPP